MHARQPARIRIEKRVLLDHLGIAFDARVQADELIALDAEHTVGNLRHVGMVASQMAFCKSCHSFNPDGQDMPELPQEAADHFGHLRALPDRQIPCAMDREDSLLVLCLDLEKPHGWAPNSFTDRLSIDGVILAALYIRFDVASRHELHIMAKLGQLASPVMGRPAGLHSDDTGRKRLKKGQQLRAFGGLIEDHAVVLRNAMYLKNILGPPFRDMAPQCPAGQ